MQYNSTMMTMTMTTTIDPLIDRLFRNGRETHDAFIKRIIMAAAIKAKEQQKLQNQIFYGQNDHNSQQTMAIKQRTNLSRPSSTPFHNHHHHRHHNHQIQQKHSNRTTTTTTTNPTLIAPTTQTSKISTKRDNFPLISRPMIFNPIRQILSSTTAMYSTTTAPTTTTTTTKTQILLPVLFTKPMMIKNQQWTPSSILQHPNKTLFQVVVNVGEKPIVLTDVTPTPITASFITTPLSEIIKATSMNPTIKLTTVASKIKFLNPGIHMMLKQMAENRKNLTLNTFKHKQKDELAALLKKELDAKKAQLNQTKSITDKIKNETIIIGHRPYEKPSHIYHHQHQHHNHNRQNSTTTPKPFWTPKISPIIRGTQTINRNVTKFIPTRHPSSMMTIIKNNDDLSLFGHSPNRFVSLRKPIKTSSTTTTTIRPLLTTSRSAVKIRIKNLTTTTKGPNLTPIFTVSTIATIIEETIPFEVNDAIIIDDNLKFMPNITSTTTMSNNIDSDTNIFFDLNSDESRLSNTSVGWNNRSTNVLFNDDDKDSLAKHSIKLNELATNDRNITTISTSTQIPTPTSTHMNIGIITTPTNPSYRLTTERLAYILIGSCCALSVICLIIVAMSVRFKDMCDEYRHWKQAEKAALRWQQQQRLRMTASQHHHHHHQHPNQSHPSLTSSREMTSWFSLHPADYMAGPNNHLTNNRTNLFSNDMDFS
uniref:Myotubularin-related protein DDB_G0290005-like n=1 Tax=Dermatophagoides pteronyssinus TaxID=6956 RepID=A0A6P6XNA6_DERPT|nr:myotubularin-related protein DDB_G0290005-like [Dermatophagoides pteronyssinus]